MRIDRINLQVRFCVLNANEIVILIILSKQNRGKTNQIAFRLTIEVRLEDGFLLSGFPKKFFGDSHDHLSTAQYRRAPSCNNSWPHLVASSCLKCMCNAVCNHCSLGSYSSRPSVGIARSILKCRQGLYWWTSKVRDKVPLSAYAADKRAWLSYLQKVSMHAVWRHMCWICTQAFINVEVVSPLYVRISFSIVIRHKRPSNIIKSNSTQEI